MSTNTGVVKQFKDTGNGQNVYPITSENAVMDAQGNNLATKLGLIDESLSGKSSTVQLQSEVARAQAEENKKLDFTKSQSLTATQKKQGRANLGLGNGDIDTVPTSGSTNLVESGGVFSNTLSVASAQTLTTAQKQVARGNLGFGTIDSVPTSGSTNLVESGGVFKYIADNTGAFDITAYNNGATYSGLTQALNAVPTQFRKGGMSVRYVPTSDNKYVRYTSMASTFTVSESDWRGVDEEPTLGSHNLVESGGILTTINDAVFQTIQSDKIYSAYIDNSGNIQQSNNWTSIGFTKKEFNAIKSLSYNSLTGVYKNYLRIAFYSSNINPNSSTLISGWTFNDIESGVVSIDIIPDSCTYIIICSRNQDGQPSAEFTLSYDEVTGKLNTLSVFKILSEFQGKKISIIGDGISTFDGSLVENYVSYYPHGNVINEEQTYWQKLISSSYGSSLEINASYEGSCVTSLKASQNIPDFYDRTNLLGNPDVIIIELGYEDSKLSINLGDFEFDSPISGLTESEFRPAYIKGIKSLKTNYPNSKIYCLTTYLKSGKEYVIKASIKYIAEYFGCIYVDVSGYDTATMGEGKPSDYGMIEIANKIANSRLSVGNNKYVIVSNPNIDGHYYYSNGNKVGNNNWNAYKIDVIPGTVIQCELGNASGSNAPAINYFGANGELVLEVTGIHGRNEYTSTVPENAVCAVLCNRNANVAIPTILVYYPDFNPLTTSVSNLVKQQQSSVEKVFSSIGRVVCLSSNTTYSDITWVGNKMVGFISSEDDYSTTGTFNIMTFDNGINKPSTDAAIAYHTLGHCNTVDYCGGNDCLILGNGSGDYTLAGKIIIVQNFSQIISDNTQYPSTSPLSVSDPNVIVIDCSTYNLGTKFNVIWGENNVDASGLQYDIAYLITAKKDSVQSAVDAGDNGTIRRILLGRGTNELTYGTLLSGKTSTEFNGTFDILDTYIQPGTNYYNGCNQGTCYCAGRILSSVNHNGLNVWSMRLDNGKVCRNEYSQKTYDADGQETTRNISGICVKDNYLYIGCGTIGTMCFEHLIE